MAFKLTQADQDALQNVNIKIDGSSDTEDIILDLTNLMFPPVITKDSKSAKFLEVESGSFEPFKYYVQSNSRQIALEFQWVAGGEFPPERIHRITSEIKAYFYGAYFGSDRKNYPAVTIFELYDIVPQGGGESSTWRMMNVDVKRSKELVKIEDSWYALHTVLTMNLESASQLQNPNEGEAAPVFEFDNLVKFPQVEWY